MKIFSLGVFVTLVFLFAGCKKDKNKSTPNFGCNSMEVKYKLENQAGILAYFSSKNKWVFVYQSQPGNYSNFFLAI